MSVSYHWGVPAADELADLMEDAFAVDAFVQRTSLHDDRHSQQDLLTDVLLQAVGEGLQSRWSTTMQLKWEKLHNKEGL